MWILLIAFVRFRHLNIAVNYYLQFVRGGSSNVVQFAVSPRMPVPLPNDACIIINDLALVVAVSGNLHVLPPILVDTKFVEGVDSMLSYIFVGRYKIRVKKKNSTKIEQEIFSCKYLTNICKLRSQFMHIIFCLIIQEILHKLLFYILKLTFFSLQSN